MTHRDTPDNRRALLAACRRGELSPREIAEALGVTHQAALTWVRAAKIDWKAARAGYAQRRAYALLVGRFESKANKRRRAYRAWDDFTD